MVERGRRRRRLFHRDDDLALGPAGPDAVESGDGVVEVEDPVEDRADRAGVDVLFDPREILDLVDTVRLSLPTLPTDSPRHCAVPDRMGRAGSRGSRPAHLTPTRDTRRSPRVEPPYPLGVIGGGRSDGGRSGNPLNSGQIRLHLTTRQRVKEQHD